MLLDCETCPARAVACDGCVVAAVLDPTRLMAPDEAAAVSLLHRSGLIGPPHLAVIASSRDLPGDMPAAAPFAG